MRAILDHSPSLIAVKDLDGRYLMSNVQTQRLLGLTEQEIVGRHCGELFPTIAAQMQVNDRRAAATMAPVYDDTEITVDGTRRTFLTATFALPGEEGRPIETCTIATDVTEAREQAIQREERRRWEERIGDALDADQLVAFAQPVMELATGRADWYELLARLEDPPRTAPLEPVHFLPAAERWDLIQAIDVRMVERALALAGTRGVQVNLSAVTLCDPTARRRIVQLLESSAESASRLAFEITETAAPGHLDAAEQFAHQVSALGCGLGLDDFGTGFGSFTYLRRLPLRFVKIDQSFVRGIVDSRSDRRVVQSIIDVAGAHGLTTIAEGVEDEPTLDLLRVLGADFAQGFHLGLPEAVEAPELSRVG